MGAFGNLGTSDLKVLICFALMCLGFGHLIGELLQQLLFS